MDSSAPPPPPAASSPPPPPSSPIALKPSGSLPFLSPRTVRPPPDQSSPSSSSLQSVLIIAGIIAICAIASISIFCLLRFLSIRRHRHRRSSSSVAALPLPLFDRRSSSTVTDSAAPTAVSCETPSAALSEKEKKALIDSLPLFSLASSVPALPKSSPDCAVCLSPFLPNDELRLLPACRHAFHASCIEKWLVAGDTPTCPLCRASITLHHPPLLPPAPPPETASTAAISVSERSRSGSFRIEIGSVSLRTAPPSGEPGNPSARPRPPSLSPPVRTYSIDSEWDYLVEEEVEAVVAGTAMPTEKSEKPSEAGAPAAPAAVVQAGQVAGSGRSSRWLRDYVDRLSSASSSLRFSGRWSNQYDSGDAAAVVRQPSWHWEGSARRDAAEDGGIFGFYRWLVGAY